jgi:hypothetical protein
MTIKHKQLANRARDRSAEAKSSSAQHLEELSRMRKVATAAAEDLAMRRDRSSKRKGLSQAYAGIAGSSGKNRGPACETSWRGAVACSTAVAMSASEFKADLRYAAMILMFSVLGLRFPTT